MTYELTVIVNFFNMPREAPRTLHSLSRAYQRGIDGEGYAVIAVENGSSQRLDPTMVRSFGPGFRHFYQETDNPCPAAAMNQAVAECDSPFVALMIDGARMLSPGVLGYMFRAFRSFRNPLPHTLGMHLGPGLQNVTVTRGYCQEEEDRLLAACEWRRNGYALFGISAPAASSEGGYFSRLAESNCFALRRSSYERLGGFDESFRSPGGGLVNLDFFNRACSCDAIEPVMILGEANFHQFHGGEATNVPWARHPWKRFAGEYERIRGHPYRKMGRVGHFIGHWPEECPQLLRVSGNNP